MRVVFSCWCELDNDAQQHQIASFRSRNSRTQILSVLYLPGPSPGFACTAVALLLLLLLLTCGCCCSRAVCARRKYSSRSTLSAADMGRRANCLASFTADRIVTPALASLRAIQASYNSNWILRLITEEAILFEILLPKDPDSNCCARRGVLARRQDGAYQSTQNASISLFHFVPTSLFLSQGQFSRTS
jgi:hypothetical protein